MESASTLPAGTVNMEIYIDIFIHTQQVGL